MLAHTATDTATDGAAVEVTRGDVVEATALVADSATHALLSCVMHDVVMNDVGTHSCDC